MRRHMASPGVAIAAVALATVLSAAEASGQAFEIVRGKQPIPREPYKTWSLFLVTNQDWLVPENARRLQQLYERSEAFGRVIGADHLAVWFWRADESLSSPALAANVDVERAVAYCQKLGLKPSQGPYLLFTTTYPDESVAPEAYTVIQVDKSAEEIGRLLDRLGDQLVTEGIVDDGTLRDAVGSDDFWSAWFDATRHALASLGSGFRFVIRTPTFTIESGTPPGGGA